MGQAMFAPFTTFVEFPHARRSIYRLPILS